MSTPVAITGATIIDGCGGDPIENGVVVINGDRIVSVGDASTPIPNAAFRMESVGKFIIPGLMDSSIYLFCDRPPIAAIRYEGRYDELMIEAAQLTLKSGVTTVFDAWGPRKYLVRARDLINEGRCIGSRIFCSGTIIGAGGPLSDDFYPEAAAGLFEYANELNSVWEEGVGPDLMWKSPDEFRSVVRNYMQSGIDYVKYAVNSLHPVKPPYLVFSPRFQGILVEEAHRAGLVVQSFSVSVEGIHQAMEAGVDILGHVDVTGPRQTIPADTAAMVARRGIPSPMLLNTREAMAWYLRKASWYGNLERNQRTLLDAGARLVLATDAGILSANTRTYSAWGPETPPWDSLLINPGTAHFNWLLAAEERGVSAMDGLLAATREVARAYRVDKDLGTLEAGKIADLVILDRNPLESAANYRSVAEVIKEGKVVDRSALPSRRILSVAGD